MNTLRDILIIIASIAIVIYVSDKMADKYYQDEYSISCINDDVEKTLINVTTSDLKESLNSQGYILKTSVIKEDTTTEDRKFTVGDKSKYSCNTSIQLELTAKPNNQDSINYIKSIANDRDSFITTFNRDYTVVENDLGTQYWVESKKIMEYQLLSKITD